MGKYRDLLMLGAGVKPDHRTDEEVHRDVLMEMASRGELPYEYEQIFQKVLAEFESEQKNTDKINRASEDSEEKDD